MAESGTLSKPKSVYPQPRIALRRFKHVIWCLFFGKRGLCLTVTVPSKSQNYSGQHVECDKLKEEIEEVAESLDIGTTGEIRQLTNGVYVYVYRHIDMQHRYLGKSLLLLPF